MADMLALGTGVDADFQYCSRLDVLVSRFPQDHGMHKDIGIVAVALDKTVSARAIEPFQCD